MIAGVKREKDIDEHEEEGMFYLFIIGVDSKPHKLNVLQNH